LLGKIKCDNLGRREEVREIAGICVQSLEARRSSRGGIKKQAEKKEKGGTTLKEGGDRRGNKKTETHCFSKGVVRKSWLPEKSRKLLRGRGQNAWGCWVKGVDTRVSNRWTQSQGWVRGGKRLKKKTTGITESEGVGYCPHKELNKRTSRSKRVESGPEAVKPNKSTPISLGGGYMRGKSKGF